VGLKRWEQNIPMASIEWMEEKIPLEKRLDFAKKMFAEMCVIKSSKRDWYLQKQYRTIRKIRKMIEEKGTLEERIRDAKAKLLQMYDAAKPAEIEAQSAEIKRLKALKPMTG